MIIFSEYNFRFQFSGIAQFMLEPDEDGNPSNRTRLTGFVDEEMVLPFAMHSAHRSLWKAISGCKQPSLSLVEFLQIVHACLQNCILPAWLAFASDCAEQFVARGNHFVEKSEEVPHIKQILNCFSDTPFIFVNVHCS